MTAAEPINDLSTLYQVDASDLDHIRDQQFSIGNGDTLIIHMGALSQIEWLPELGSLAKMAGRIFIVGDDYRAVQREVTRTERALVKHGRVAISVEGLMTALDLSDDPRPPGVIGGRVWPIADGDAS